MGETLAQHEIRLFDRSFSAFKVWGYTGLLLAILLTMALVTRLGLSRWLMAVLIASAVLTFLTLALMTKIISGRENLVFYYHAIVITILAVILLKLLGRPVCPYLDVMILGVGLFHACGRVGCLLVGCCHGRPSRWGICYREEHAAAGFPFYLVNVRLFPLQAVESFWVLGLVVVGSVLALHNRHPGEALAWYVIGYGIGRFYFEFKRGDAERHYLLGFSEAQWTSLLLICVSALAGLLNVLPLQRWQLDIIGIWLLVVIVLALRRPLGRTAKDKLLHPQHLKEIAQTLERISETASEIAITPKPDDIQSAVHVGCTSLGIRISAGWIKSAAGNIYHYALSSQSSAMTEVSARMLAELILQLRHPRGSNQLIQGHQGVFHLLVYPSIAVCN
ncbi:MAG: prolipoprotein diacylglyceryl transferase family protein [Pyrinomonadaceae bacterium]